VRLSPAFPPMVPLNPEIDLINDIILSLWLIYMQQKEKMRGKGKKLIQCLREISNEVINMFDAH